MVPNQPTQVMKFYESMTGTYLSSGYDGFMREFVSLLRIVLSYKEIEDTVAAITEFVGIGMHAMGFMTVSHSRP